MQKPLGPSAVPTPHHAAPVRCHPLHAALLPAGMRQLWATGWLQQSVRMVVACFLVEYLRLPWTTGAAWFHDTLVDADVAINSMSWQNAAACGLDQWEWTLLPTSRSQVCVYVYVCGGGMSVWVCVGVCWGVCAGTGRVSVGYSADLDVACPTSLSSSRHEPSLSCHSG